MILPAHKQAGLQLDHPRSILEDVWGLLASLRRLQTCSRSHTQSKYTHRQSKYTHRQSKYTHRQSKYTHRQSKYTQTEQVHTQTEQVHTQTEQVHTLSQQAQVSILARNGTSPVTKSEGLPAHPELCSLTVRR
eukprot:768406-Hanusia_phi.AAC.2